MNEDLLRVVALSFRGGALAMHVPARAIDQLLDALRLPTPEGIALADYRMQVHNAMDSLSRGNPEPLASAVLKSLNTFLGSAINPVDGNLQECLKWMCGGRDADRHRSLTALGAYLLLGGALGQSVTVVGPLYACAARSHVLEQRNLTYDEFASLCRRIFEVYERLAADRPDTSRAGVAGMELRNERGKSIVVMKLPFDPAVQMDGNSKPSLIQGAGNRLACNVSVGTSTAAIFELVWEIGCLARRIIPDVTVEDKHVTVTYRWKTEWPPRGLEISIKSSSKNNGTGEFTLSVPCSCGDECWKKATR